MMSSSQPITVNVDLDTAAFYREFIALMSSPTPPARP